MESRGLADPVGAQKAHHSALLRQGQPEQAEPVETVLVHQFLVQLLGQVDDGNGLEGALVDADAATDAEDLGYLGLVGAVLVSDALGALPVDGAEIGALLPAPVRLATVPVQRGYPHRTR